jgi:DNA-binding MarR family transcriptional regulator
MIDKRGGTVARRLVTKHDYETLAAFRGELRWFLRFSEDAARAVGLTPQQHQLLLTIMGTPGRDYATIKEIAEHLQLRHHTVVGLIDRMEGLGLIARRHSTTDHRVVEVTLMPQGEDVLRTLTIAHKEELVRLTAVWRHLAAIIDGTPQQES